MTVIFQHSHILFASAFEWKKCLWTHPTRTRIENVLQKQPNYQHWLVYHRNLSIFVWFFSGTHKTSTEYFRIRHNAKCMISKSNWIEDIPVYVIRSEGERTEEKFNGCVNGSHEFFSGKELWREEQRTISWKNPPVWPNFEAFLIGLGTGIWVLNKIFLVVLRYYELYTRSWKRIDVVICLIHCSFRLFSRHNISRLI